MQVIPSQNLVILIYSDYKRVDLDKFLSSRSDAVDVFFPVVRGASHLKRMVSSNRVNLIQSTYIAVPNSPFIVMDDVTSHKKGLEYR